MRRAKQRMAALVLAALAGSVSGHGGGERPVAPAATGEPAMMTHDCGGVVGTRGDVAEPPPRLSPEEALRDTAGSNPARSLPPCTSYLAPTYGLAGWLHDVGYGYLGDGLEITEVRDGPMADIFWGDGVRGIPGDGVNPGRVPELDDGGRVYAAEWPAQLTEGQVRAVLAEAGVPEEWHADLVAIGWCESKWSPGAIGDGGASLGLWQLWTGWFREGEEPRDPVTNARVAGRVRAQRGRFGGGGGWTCADLRGIE